MVKNLITYFNDVLTSGKGLSYNQNLLEHTYIPKDNSIYKNFENVSPITKTSPKYKLLDTILNERLQI